MTDSQQQPLAFRDICQKREGGERVLTLSTLVKTSANMKLNENEFALVLVAVLAVALIVRAVPESNSPMVAALAGGLLGFLKGGGARPPR